MQYNDNSSWLKTEINMQYNIGWIKKKLTGIDDFQNKQMTFNS